MSKTEAVNQFNNARKLGQKYVKTCLAARTNPYPQVLEQLVNESLIAGRRNLGLVEIPMELIVGTRAAGRQNAFAGNFMPLLGENTEFGMKWVRLCEAHLGDVGITDPIQCFEYLGRFYVQEGNKRVSVLKSYDCTSVTGSVVRLIPAWSEDPQVQAYYAFMEFYERSHLYQMQFEQPGSYAKLQAALGFDADHVWTDEERAAFLAGYYRFRTVFEPKKEQENSAVSLAGALLMWLQLYSLADLRAMTQQELEMSLTALWPDILFMAKNRPAMLSTAPEKEEKSLIGKLLASRLSHLNVAFVHSVDPAVSRWAMGHELGREHLADTLGEYVDIRTYCVGEQTADELMELAVQEGAELIIATAPSLIPASRKIAARYPDLRVLNCALSVPYAGIRTYYCRIHEAKFITGAIAGIVAGPGRDVGYVANYPIFGVPAAINAYALGVRMTNPTAKVKLGWSCVEEKPAYRMADEGVRVISNREFNANETSHKGINWGTYLVQEDGSRKPLASPCWNWGELYEKAVRAILDGAWDPLDDHSRTAVTYWWGMDSGVIDISFDESLPDGVAQLGRILKAGLCEGAIDPFHCRITDQNGILRNDGSSWFIPEEVMHMDWLCDNVEGHIPHYDEILPMSRNMVRLLGVYRDEIPPEKESVQI